MREDDPAPDGVDEIAVRVRSPDDVVATSAVAAAGLEYWGSGLRLGG